MFLNRGIPTLIIGFGAFKKVSFTPNCSQIIKQLLEMVKIITHILGMVINVTNFGLEK